tara:strand:- start:1467 stop:2051 length:585 start_codon:yes stop_codon:yes gene_type:complete
MQERPIQKKIIKITWYEASTVLHITNLRHIESLRKGFKHRHGYKPTIGEDIQDNFYGAMGELAFAKATDTYFPMSVNTFKEADVGINWQVRTVGSHRNRDLLIRPNDPTKHKYVLVEITNDPSDANMLLGLGTATQYIAIIHGWIEGVVGKKPEYLTHMGHPDRPKVYRIAQDALRCPSWIPIRRPERSYFESS